VLITHDKYQITPIPAFVPGVEFAGLIDAVGEGVDNYKTSDMVAVFTSTGGFGAYAVVSTTEIMMPLPTIFRKASIVMRHYPIGFVLMLEKFKTFKS